jgi:DNA-directed RNA polymerase subunit RPC12/RpoP
MKPRAQRTIVCAECQTTFTRDAVGSARVIHCDRCRHERFAVQKRAANALSNGLRHGLVESYMGKACVDCCEPAQCLDHRDYTKPLEVEPVCLSCNFYRPPAKWRTA